MGEKPGAANRRFVIVLKGDAQRQEFCRANGITAGGRALSEYLWDITYSGINEALNHQALEALDVLAIKKIAERVRNAGRRAIGRVLTDLENEALINLVTHIGINFAHSVGIIFSLLLSHGSQNLITLEIDQSISGIPKPIERDRHHTSTFVTPPISKDNARSARALARTLGLTQSACESRIKACRLEIQNFCREDSVFQEAWA
jgi:hypothetical protein